MNTTSLHSKCSHCPTRENTEWKDLTEEHLELIDKFKKVSDQAPGDIIYQQGESGLGVYCIQSGLVSIRQIYAEGNEVLLRLCNPGETIGYRALLSNGEHTHFAEILAPSHICFIDGSIVKELLSQNPFIGERFLIRTLKELDEAEGLFVRSQKQNIRSRLLHYLMVLFVHHGAGDAQSGFVLKIPVSWKNIASLIAASPESVSRTISLLEKDGLIYFEGRNAYFSNMEAILDEIGAVN